MLGLRSRGGRAQRSAESHVLPVEGSQGLPELSVSHSRPQFGLATGSLCVAMRDTLPESSSIVPAKSRAKRLSFTKPKKQLRFTKPKKQLHWKIQVRPCMSSIPSLTHAWRTAAWRSLLRASTSRLPLARPAHQSCPVILMFSLFGSLAVAPRPPPSDTRQLHRKRRRSRRIPPRPPAVRESSFWEAWAPNSIGGV